ncbi:hypothetical protein PsorP6_000081 [Peronosclerospora sorghi]|uniref:Uncharacterized protein n=1 Tax=Peronosclerospora sorghi TaxID=230839 RepID=A0ACC0WT36_9STRA|nr:hypothetical protein PsorP6_000081 [Peronosclerospora sorghi]
MELLEEYEAEFDAEDRNSVVLHLVSKILGPLSGHAHQWRHAPRLGTSILSTMEPEHLYHHLVNLLVGAATGFLDDANDQIDHI